MNFYEELSKKFPVFLKNIGKEKELEYADSIITCDADKCEQYRYAWENAGIPFVEGTMIYLIEKMDPYCREARISVPAVDFVIKNYEKFKQYMP